MLATRVTACAAALVLAWSSWAGAAVAGAGAVQAYPAFGLAESSGMAASAVHDGVVWVVEDGNFDQSLPPVVHAYDRTGTEVGNVTLDGWNNRDVEALSMGPGPALWVADIGDNDAERESVVVHTFPEPAELGESTLEPVSYRLRYPDGPRDAESIMVDPLDGRLYVATKSVLGGGTLFIAPAALEPGATHDLEPVARVPSLVTDGTFTSDGRRMVLLASGLRPAAVVMDAVRGEGDIVIELVEADRLDLPSQEQPESLTITPDGTAVLVGSEGEEEPVWSLPLLAEPGATEAPNPSGPVAEPGAPTSSVASDGCRLSDPSSCLDEPIGWLAAAAVAIVALMTTALAVLRRSRP